jgi:hypothetical protein
LSKVLIQPDARPFTRPVGSTRLSQRTNEPFDVSIQISESLDSIGENPACSCVLVQELLSFVCHIFWASQIIRRKDLRHSPINCLAFSS